MTAAERSRKTSVHCVLKNYHISTVSYNFVTLFQGTGANSRDNMMTVTSNSFGVLKESAFKIKTLRSPQNIVDISLKLT